MRTFMVGLLSVFLAIPVMAQVPAAPAPAKEEAPKISEVEKLKLELHAFKIRVVQLEAQLSQATSQLQVAALQQERNELSTSIKAPEGWEIDFGAGALKKKEPPKADPKEE